MKNNFIPNCPLRENKVNITNQSYPKNKLKTERITTKPTPHDPQPPLAYDETQ